MKKIMWKTISLITTILILSLQFVQPVCADSGTDVVADELKAASIPVYSTETDWDSLDICLDDSGVYCALEDIAVLSRYSLEEADGEYTLIQGIRSVIIDPSTGSIMDMTGIYDGQNIKTIVYDNRVFCEAIPLLEFLGVKCVLDDNKTLFLYTEPLTFWEAIDTKAFNYIADDPQIVGSDNDRAISLTCSWMADLFDIRGGILSKDHIKELSGPGRESVAIKHALLDILDVQAFEKDALYAEEDTMMTMASVTNDTTDVIGEYRKLYFDGVLERIKQTFYESGLACDVELQEQSYYKYLEQVLKNHYDEQLLSDVNGGLSTLISAANFTLNVSKMSRYDTVSRTLFRNCINDSVKEYTGVSFSEIEKEAASITKELSNNSSIVLKEFFSEIENQFFGKSEEAVINFITSEKTLPVLAAKLSVGLLENTVLADQLNAFADDADMYYIADIQYTTYVAATNCLTKVFGEKSTEKNHLEMLYNLMSFYYRSSAAFYKNATASLEEFGNKKVKDEYTKYLSEVQKYMEKKLYDLNGCIVPDIVAYNTLSDDIFSSEWIESISSMDWQEAYTDFVCDYTTDVQYAPDSEPRFILAHIDDDDIPELVILPPAQNNYHVEVYSMRDGKVVKLGDPNGTMGHFVYTPYMNMIRGGMSTRGGLLRWFMEINGNSISERARVESTFSYNGITETEKSTCYLDDSVVSTDEFNQFLSQYTPVVSVGFDEAYTRAFRNSDLIIHNPDALFFEDGAYNIESEVIEDTDGETAPDVSAMTFDFIDIINSNSILSLTSDYGMESCTPWGVAATFGSGYSYCKDNFYVEYRILGSGKPQISVKNESNTGITVFGTSIGDSLNTLSDALQQNGYQILSESFLGENKALYKIWNSADDYNEFIVSYDANNRITGWSWDDWSDRG